MKNDHFPSPLVGRLNKSMHINSTFLDHNNLLETTWLNFQLGVSVSFSRSVRQLDCMSFSQLPHSRATVDIQALFRGPLPSAITQFSYAFCTPLDRKNTLVTRIIGYIDLQLIYTIPERCNPLYIPPRRNLHSPRIKRHGSIRGADLCENLLSSSLLKRMKVEINPFYHAVNNGNIVDDSRRLPLI